MSEPVANTAGETEARPRRDRNAERTDRHNTRERREWLMVAGLAAGIMLLLAILSYQGDRAARDGFLAGVGWIYLQTTLLTILIFTLFTLGLSLEFGFTGLINFGHVLFLGLGAYTAAILSWKSQLAPGHPDAWAWLHGLKSAIGFDLSPTASLGPAVLGILIVLLVAVTVSMGAALLLGLPTLRLREDYLAIVTIGAAEIMRTAWLNESHITAGPEGINVRLPGAAWVLNENSAWGKIFVALEDGPLHIKLDPYFSFILLLVLVALAGAFLLVERLVRSPWGRVVKAIREDEDVAASLGKNVFKVKLQSLALGSVIASVAGVLFVYFTRFITPNSFLPLVTFYAWIILVVGGAGNHKGVIVGSFALWGVFETARQLQFLGELGPTASGPQQIIFIGLMLVIIMMFRPQGAMGRREEMLYAR